MARRRQNFQNIGWFLDLHKRQLLELNPPFQRRSVWNQTYRDQFIDTILLDYPAPAIFLFPTTDVVTGSTRYDLVDGKQRLTAIFDFVKNLFPVSEDSELIALRGTYFEKLAVDDKVKFYEYDFSVELLPTNNAQIINNIFNRLNKNTAKLTAQELRHARYNGLFITATEESAEWMSEQLGKKFPHIKDTSRRQMKDVEMVATLFLFLEEGTKSHSADTLDEAFNARDAEWEAGSVIVDEFRSVVSSLASLIKTPGTEWIANSRLRNQADFGNVLTSCC